jgi:hypothetical protein
MFLRKSVHAPILATTIEAAKTVDRFAVSNFPPYGYDIFQGQAQVQKPSSRRGALYRLRSEEYCPVHPGQLLGLGYRVVGKVGYGANSTVWLCRNDTRR